MAKTLSYFYTPCESRDQSTNEMYKHYFRLYKQEEGGQAILVEQGNSVGLTDSWESKFNATFVTADPYPNLQ